MICRNHHRCLPKSPSPTPTREIITTDDKVVKLKPGISDMILFKVTGVLTNLTRRLYHL